MSKVDELIKSLRHIKDALNKDEIDEKIKAKLKAEMDKRNFTEVDATRHVIDRDRGDKQPAPPKPPKQLLQTERMVFKNNGQWDLEKDNSVKPFGTSIYNSTANIGRKATRTGEERPEMGGNQGVRQYTTSGSSMSQAHEAAAAKEQKAKSKVSVRTFADMSEEEKAEMKAKYEKPLAKGADIVREALTTGNLPIMGESKLQPTNKEMFGHLVVSPEVLEKAEQRYQSGNKDVVAELSKPVDHLNKSKVETAWKYGRSFNSLLKEELTDKEIAERNSYVGE